MASPHLWLLSETGRGFGGSPCFLSRVLGCELTLQDQQEPSQALWNFALPGIGVP